MSVQIDDPYRDISPECWLEVLRSQHAERGAAWHPAFHAHRGWHEAYGPRQARAHAARTIARFVAGSIAGFGRWAVNLVRARELLSSIPAEGSPYVPVDAVKHARNLLLGQP